ncbi:protein MON2 homolog isoform X3 [Apostichopus japonicus]|uniref:protein MON2 homolog isoform X3 n=1 Tax=Stichopus japonicus TaxID=307972 RepID=UPI003AB2C196
MTHQREAAARRLMENLQTDLRALSVECKRKYPPVKEAAEAGMLKLKTISTRSKQIESALVANSGEILQPFLLGCDTRNMKNVQLSLTSIQRLITHEAVSANAACNVINMLWNLMESGTEDLKVLQTAVVVLTTNTVVRGPMLAKAIVICFRLHYSKDNTTSNTASAVVQQVVTMVFERVMAEDEANADGSESNHSAAVKDYGKGDKEAPKTLRPCATDAYLLFQDLCSLVNGDQPYWLKGMTGMSRTFGIELIEAILNAFPPVFLRHSEFSFQLKERVCPLLIKLFSPSLKHRQGLGMPVSNLSPEKPSFPLSLRLLRVVSVLINKYYALLITECEIFLSLLVKFTEGDKPHWQRVQALEVLMKLCHQPKLLRCFCASYDMKPHSTKIFGNIINALGAFIQSLFVNPAGDKQSGLAGEKMSKDSSGSPTIGNSTGSLTVAAAVSNSAFFYKGTWIPLVPVNASNPSKTAFLELLDKGEPPPVPDGYGMSVALCALLDAVKGVSTVVTYEMDTEEKLWKARPDVGSLRQAVKMKMVDKETERAKNDEDKDIDEQEDQEEDGKMSFPRGHHLYAMWTTLVESSWCGVMSALSLLLEACTDEAATESILKSLELYASLCGKLDQTVSRDAFVTSLCRSALPAHYALTVLNIATPQSTSNAKGHRRQASKDSLLQGGGSNDGSNGDLGDGRNQVVAVGTPLSTLHGTVQGPVMLTAKNIQCMRAILSLSCLHGSVLGSAWHQILTTLQHLVWILGLKPISGGTLKVGHTADAPNTVITTAVMAELPILTSMLSRLFESSQYLDEVALHHMIDALCKLSSEAMEIAYSNKEPSLFPVAKLLESGLVNLPRMESWWKPVTAHLLEVCQHSHVKLREFSAEAVTDLITSSVEYKHEPPLHHNLKLQAILLGPLQELSSIPHADIRQKQLECVHQLLSSSGDCLVHGWPLVLGVIGAVTQDQGENLIRASFQSLQLVVTDFLPIMPCYCLQISVETAARFGLQKEELNISLTAVGLLWNISDYLYQNRDTIRESLEQDSKNIEIQTGSEKPVPPFDALWLTLYSRLADLCVDSRPAVRKSAGQTLFSTISVHGSLLELSTWQIVLWQVLFPLLDKVKNFSGAAAHERGDATAGGNILIHHSRDTTEKQWAETKVLTLAGVARVFNTWRHALMPLGDFPRAWALLLQHIESSALSPSKEVSLNALKSFQDVLQLKPPKKLNLVKQVSSASSSSEKQTDDTALSDDLIIPADEAMSRSENVVAAPEKESSAERTSVSDSTDLDNDVADRIDSDVLWSNAWRVWYGIGIASTKPPLERTANLPSQAFLTALVKIFPLLFKHIRLRFVSSDLQKFFLVLQNAVSVPVQADMSVFILPSAGENELTPLQEAILHSIKILQGAISDGTESMQSMYPAIFDQLLTFVTYSCQAPSFGHIETKAISKVSSKQEKWDSFKASAETDWVAMNYVPFAEKSLEFTADLYKSTARHPVVMEEHVLQNILRVLQLPLGLKYACPSPSTWKLSVQCLLDILRVGLPVARAADTTRHFSDVWLDMAASFELFLFADHPTPSTLTVEEQQNDELLDVSVVELIRQEILPFSSSMPDEFTHRIMALLNRGSIHSTSTASFLDVDDRQLRQEFAKACFETLLQFSFITQKAALQNSSDEGALTKMALTSLLGRCQEVLKKYVEDERLSGKCPLPRSRMTEMSFVLQAITTLIQSLKRATQENVDPSTWDQVISLYPSLVDCCTCSSSQVCNSLKKALYEYQDLLVPPHQRILNGK